jgi:hypothetical protein
VSKVKLWALDGWWRLGGHDGMWVGVKVRAELDRVSGVALTPIAMPSTMCGGCPVLEVGSFPFRGLRLAATARQGWCVPGSAQSGRSASTWTPFW